MCSGNRDSMIDYQLKLRKSSRLVYTTFSPGLGLYATGARSPDAGWKAPVPVLSVRGMPETNRFLA